MPDESLEHTVEMALAAVPKLRCDFGRSRLSVDEEIHGLVDAKPMDILQIGRAGCSLESAAEMRGA